jgi:hypothetical protein
MRYLWDGSRPPTWGGGVRDLLDFLGWLVTGSFRTEHARKDAGHEH